MEWHDWVMYQPQTKSDIITKIENDGYTYPHYDKLKNKVRYIISVFDIKRDCQKVGIDLQDVYPLQTTLF